MSIFEKLPSRKEKFEFTEKEKKWGRNTRILGDKRKFKFVANSVEGEGIQYHAVGMLYSPEGESVPAEIHFTVDIDKIYIYPTKWTAGKILHLPWEMYELVIDGIRQVLKS